MIQYQNISKTYKTPHGEVHALHRVDLTIDEGEFVVLRGSSGSGKTTLLMATGGMLRPSQGKILVNQEDIYSLPIPKRAQFRASHIGFVFQMFHLVHYLSVMDNVLLASGVANHSNADQKAKSLLERLGMNHRIHHKPAELSAGEKQRTAIARALLNSPKLILADEPTGNLDPDNANEVLKHLSEYHKNGGSVLLVTHGNAADQYADRIIHIRDGQIVP